MKRVTFIMVLAVLVCSFGVANADLVSMDGGKFGTDAITLDTETSLEWLDITFSTNYSYNQIIAETQSGGYFEGYRLATFTEMIGLWTNADIDLNYANVFTPINYGPISNLQSFIGTTNLDETQTWGMVDPTGSGTSTDMAAGLLFVDAETSGRYSPYYGFDSNFAREDFGSYLVKTTAVPLPSSIILLGTGLLGIMTVSRRKLKNS